MRQIHENVGVYLTLVFISNNFKPNVDLHSTMFILCWDAGIEPSITWKCPPTSVLPAAECGKVSWGQKAVFISNNFKPKVDLHPTMFILCWDAGDRTLHHLEMSFDLCATCKELVECLEDNKQSSQLD